MVSEELNCIKKELERNLPVTFYDLGKLIRSKVTLLLLKSLEIEINKDILTILTGTELIHNASLMHDDIIDKNGIRRNSQTIYKKEGSTPSLLYGNIALINAINMLLTLNSTDIISIFNSTVVDMCKGELLQYQQQGKMPTLEEYLLKTELKTARLFTAPIRAISTLTQLPENVFNVIKNYGIAFQIKNDITNILTTNSDYIQGIYTAPIIYENNPDKINIGIEKTLSLIDNYKRECLNYLGNISDNKYKRELIGEIECLNRLERDTTNTEKSTLR